MPIFRRFPYISLLCATLAAVLIGKGSPRPVLTASVSDRNVLRFESGFRSGCAEG